MIVICGFLMAGFFINTAFASWKTSPISTNIETYPIADAPFPIVTVCPPKGSHTALNYDLVRAENVKFNLTVRNELIDLTELVFYEELITENNAFVHQDKYRNWYKGISQFFQ